MEQIFNHCVDVGCYLQSCYFYLVLKDFNQIKLFPILLMNTCTIISGEYSCYSNICKYSIGEFISVHFFSKMLKTGIVMITKA